MEHKYFTLWKNHPNGRKEILKCSFGPTDENGVFNEIATRNEIERSLDSGIFLEFIRFLSEEEYTMGYD